MPCKIRFSVKIDFVVKVCAHLGSVDEFKKFLSTEPIVFNYDFLCQLQQELEKGKPAFSFIDCLPTKDKNLILDGRKRIQEIVRMKLMLFEIQEKVGKLDEKNLKTIQALADFLNCPSRPLR